MLIADARFFEDTSASSDVCFPYPQVHYYPHVVHGGIPEIPELWVDHSAKGGEGSWMRQTYPGRPEDVIRFNNPGPVLIPMLSHEASLPHPNWYEL
jgi:hypothetical protein